MPKNSYRFNEIEEFNEKNIFFAEIPFVSAQSNSTFSSSGKTSFAENALDENYGYWCSNEQKDDNSIVYWQGEISSSQQKFSHIIIKWAYAPYFCSIQSSVDGQNYFDSIPWRKCATGEMNKKWNEVFSWWKWKDRSFIEIIDFRQVISAKYIRILMRKPVVLFFGIYNVKLLNKKANVIIKTSIHRKEFCLVKTNFSSENVFIINCVESMAFLNNSDIFKISNNNQISTISDKKCLTYFENALGLLFSNCDIKNSQKNSWNIFSNDRVIHLLNDSKKCLTAENELYMLKFNDVFVSATSTMNDNQHESNNVFRNNAELSWISSPGDKDVRFIVKFKETPVQRIKITWKHKPKIFIFLTLYNDFFWKNISFISNFTDSEATVEIDDIITGVKIIFIEGDELFNEKIVYGIRNIQIFTKFKKILLGNCEENEVLKWEIEEIKSDIMQNNLNDLKKQQDFLYKNSQQLIELNNQLSDTGLINNYLGNSEKIDVKIKKIITFYKEFNEKILDFKEKNLPFEKNQPNLRKKYYSTAGSNKMKPGESCESIKKIHPRKRSGFYWIQPYCSPFPIRVYCDFDTNFPQDYFFSPNIDNLALKSLQDLKMICANHGLELLDITSIEKYETLKMFLTKINALENNNESIPIAFDKKCSKSEKYSGRFSSLNSGDSEDLFASFLKQSPVFIPEINDKYDFLSIGKRYIRPFSLEKSKVKGVLCSSKSVNSIISEKEFIEVKCSTITKYNNDFILGYNSKASFKVKCPRNCKGLKSKSFVWGTKLYKDDSSICLSAIHDKKIEAEKGGFITISINKGNITYFGTTQNGIKSLDWEKEWDYFLKIEKFENQCPLDKIKLVTKNFDLQRNEIRFFEIENNSTNEEENEEFSILEKINLVFEKKKKDLNYFNKIIEKTRIILDSMKTKIFQIEKKHQNPEFQEKTLITNSKLFEKVANHFYGILSLAKNKLKRRNDLKQKLLKEKNNLNQITFFEENYTFPFENIWEISEEIRKNNNSYIWSYKRQMILNHVSTIECFKNSNENIYFPTFLILKNKKYYDALLNIRFMSINYGLVGIAFRYKDAFNYYILELSKSFDISQNFKRIRKIKDGVSTELMKVFDGGFTENIWYQVLIKFQRDHLEIVIDKESREKKSIFPLKYNIYDGDLVSGKIALVAQNIKYLYFDDINIMPLECINLNKINQSLLYYPSTCSRFRENYQANFDMIWKIVNSLNGSSKWGYSQYYGQKKVIFQGSHGNGENIFLDPTLLELKINKICKIGTIMVDVLIKEKGYAGVAFKYRDYQNYYSLELHFLDNSSSCKLILLNEGLNQIIQENYKECSEIIGKEQWISIMIQMEENAILIFIGKRNFHLAKIFEFHPEIALKPNNKIALLSSASMNAFDNISLMPNEDYQAKIKENNPKNKFEQIKNNKSNECLVNNLYQREKFCKRSFSTKYEITFCMNKFCSICCNQEKSSKKQRRKCENECNYIIFIEPQEQNWKKCIEIEKNNLRRENKDFFNSHEINSYKNNVSNRCCIKGTNTNDNLSYRRCLDFISDILIS